MFIDSHCHLSFPELQARLPELRQAMADAQVDRALCICTTLEEFPQVHASGHRARQLLVQRGRAPRQRRRAGAHAR